MSIETEAQNGAARTPSHAAPLEFRDVVKRYPGAEKPAVNELSLEVPAGEICVLVGPSGCGKTTAMRMINRMIDMTSGDILLDGRSVTEVMALARTGYLSRWHRGQLLVRPAIL